MHWDYDLDYVRESWMYMFLQSSITVPNCFLITITEVLILVPSSVNLDAS